MYVHIVVELEVSAAEDAEFPGPEDGIKPVSPSPSTSNCGMPLKKQEEDLEQLSGLNITHCAGQRTPGYRRQLLVAGEQWLNWDTPDDQFRVRFVWNAELMRLPEWIQCGAERLAGEELVIVAPGFSYSWDKKTVKSWVLELARALAGLGHVRHLALATQVPRKDHGRMKVINFNKNLASALALADISVPFRVTYLPAHKFVLDNVCYPEDGVLDRVDLRAVRKYIIRRLGLAD